MNKLFLMVITLVPLFSFAQTREEAQKILDKTKVHYISTSIDFDMKYPIMFLDKDNKAMGGTHVDSTIQSRPYCHINAERQTRQSYSYDPYTELMNELRFKTSIEKLKIIRDGKKVSFYFGQTDPWFEVYPVIECMNVTEKNPLDLLKKLYSTIPRYEAFVDGKKTEITALHPNDPSTCIVAGEEYVKLNKLLSEVTTFGSLEIEDRVLIDSKIGTLVGLGINKAYVRFDGEQNPESLKLKFHDIQKVEAARAFKYKESVRVLSDGPYIGTVYGQIVENGETKILIKKGNSVDSKVRKILLSQIMKLN